jgi:hypothetical protein
MKAPNRSPGQGGTQVEELGWVNSVLRPLAISAGPIPLFLLLISEVSE